MSLTEEEFSTAIVDTRHWYSHFLDPSKRASRVSDGEDMLILFEILFFALRLEYARQLGITIDIEAVKEFFYVIHDWIIEVRHGNPSEYKSMTYINIMRLKEYENRLSSLPCQGSSCDPSQIK